MSQLYKYGQISKQAFYQHRQRKLDNSLSNGELLLLVRDIRNDHPRMGAKTIYKKINLDTMGRDKFEQLLMDEGFRVKKVHNYMRTTNSNGVHRYSNLIDGKKLTGVNIVWVSDITYFLLGVVFYYLTFIMDLFSRRILGYSASATMRAEEANIKALKMAFRTRGIAKYENLIHHSDGGGQYVSKEYLKLLEQRNIKVSMCDNVYDNAHMERVNGTIKNDYLKHRSITNLTELKHKLKRAAWLYNNDRPHSSLYKSMNPVRFEQYLLNITIEQRPEMTIWKRGTCVPAAQAEFFCSSFPLIKGRVDRKKELAFTPASINLPRHIGRSLQPGCSPAEPDQLIVKE